MGYYYNDPSHLGSWYVQDGQTPGQAFDNLLATGVTVSPILLYSVENTPAVSVVKPVGTQAPVDPPQHRIITPAVGTNTGKVRVSLNEDGSISRLRVFKRVTDGSEFAYPDCPDGQFWSDFYQQCLGITGLPDEPVATGLPPVETSGSGAVSVTVNNAVNLSTGVGQAIADAVTSGIDQQLQQSAQTSADIVVNVTDKINTLIDTIKSGVGDLLSGLKDALGYIAGLVLNNVGSLINFITNHIGQIVDTVKSVLNDVIVPAIEQITKVINQVNDVINNTIAPIFNAISQTYNQTVALVEAIKSDVQNGLQGILQLPTDIANGLGGIDATLIRATQQLGGTNKAGKTVDLYGALDENVGAHLGKVAAILGGQGGYNVDFTTFTDRVGLDEPSISEAGGRAFDAIFTDIRAFLGGLFTGKSSPLDFLKSLAGPTAILVTETFEAPGIAIVVVLALVEALSPFFDFIKEDIRAKSGLSKLTPGDALQAWVRGFIDQKALDEELSVNGWDAPRRQVLRDLQIFLIDVTSALDMYFRGIITEADLRSNLVDHGIITDDQNALISASYLPIDPALASRAMLRGIITEDALRTILHTNHWTDDQIALHIGLVRRPEGLTDVVSRYKRNQLFPATEFTEQFNVDGTLSVNESLSPGRLSNDPSYNQVPDAVLKAAEREGIDANTAKDFWQDSFMVPQLQTWLQLFFRNIRTRAELDHVFDYYRLPVEWREDFIIANRALIPFRTIPTMLASGIIDEAYAKSQLSAHGFDLQATEALLKFATTPKKTLAASHAQTLQTLAITTAKAFWEQGAITDAQYKTALMAHGFDEQTADLTIKTEALAAHAKERKAIAQEIVDEGIAGLITFEQAQARFSQQGFSLAESARYLKQFRAALRAQSKNPSEAELHAFLKAKIITIDEYRAGVASLGFQQNWVDAFAALRA